MINVRFAYRYPPYDFRSGLPVVGCCQGGNPSASILDFYNIQYATHPDMTYSIYRTSVYVIFSYKSGFLCQCLSIFETLLSHQFIPLIFVFSRETLFSLWRQSDVASASGATVCMNNFYSNSSHIPGELCINTSMWRTKEGGKPREVGSGNYPPFLETGRETMSKYKISKELLAL